MTTNDWNVQIRFFMLLSSFNKIWSMVTFRLFCSCIGLISISSRQMLLLIFPNFQISPRNVIKTSWFSSMMPNWPIYKPKFQYCLVYLWRLRFFFSSSFSSFSSFFFLILFFLFSSHYLYHFHLPEPGFFNFLFRLLCFGQTSFGFSFIRVNELSVSVHYLYGSDGLLSSLDQNLSTCLTTSCLIVNLETREVLLGDFGLF